MVVITIYYVVMVGKIVSKWNEQIKNAELYALETKLERSQWLKSTDGSLNTLIERNERAIQQPVG